MIEINRILIIALFASSIIFISAFSCSNKNENIKNNKLLMDDSTVIKKNEVREYIILEQIPHDVGAYTQGLIYYNNELFESTGHYGKSSIRKVDPKTGEILKIVPIPDSYFGEGITIFDDKIYMLTWESHQLLVINIETFKIVDAFTFRGEGWGLTDDGISLIMSDGTNILKFIDPKSKSVTNTVAVLRNGNPQSMLNELEYVNGKIWANIYNDDRIAVINPQNGIVERLIDFSELRNNERNNPAAEVLNGISYDKNQDIFYVTGKNWQFYYKIKIN